MNTTYHVGPSTHSGSGPPPTRPATDYSNCERANIKYNDRVLLRDSVPNWSRIIATERVCDLIGSIALTVFLAPLMAIVALAILAESKGPVIDYDVRAGVGGRLYALYRFRTHNTNTLEPSQIGRLLTKLSLDRLPRVFNVINGDMSVVGPSPAPPSAVLTYSLNQENRLAVRPGLTGDRSLPKPAAIGGDTDPVLYYIRNRSLLLNLKIVARSLGTLIVRRGTN